jgi:hypothetical protein
MFNSSLIRLASFKSSLSSGRINSSTLQTACQISKSNKNNNNTLINNKNSRISFDKLINEIENNSNNNHENLDFNIHNTLLNTLSKANEQDYRYYLQKLSESSTTWLNLYSLINQLKWYEAFKFIKYYKSTIPLNIIIYFEQSLLKNKEYSIFLNILQIYYEFIPKNDILKFINQCIEENQIDLLGKFIEKYLIYIGPTENIKNEIIKLNNEQIELLISFFEKNKNIKLYSKLINYYMNLLKSNERKDILKYNNLRFNSRLIKFNFYIEKLGPYKVLENGMFNNFKFNYNKKIKFDKHLKFFIDSLTNYFTPNIPNLEQLLLLIDFMHGYKIKPFKEQFSKSLNPDIQMARIYRSVIRKTSNPDPEILRNYSKIINMKNDKINTHLKDGLPKRETLNQRLNKDTINIKYEKLPLQIILRIIYNLIQQEQNNNNIENKRHLIAISIEIFKQMVEKHHIRPAESCFLDLVQILYTDPDAIDNIPSLVAIHHQYFGHKSKPMALVLSNLGLDMDGKK